MKGASGYVIEAMHEASVDLGVFESKADKKERMMRSLPGKKVKFKEVHPKNQAVMWNVYNLSGGMIGSIKYMKDRKTYVFEAEPFQNFDIEMVAEILKKMGYNPPTS